MKPVLISVKSVQRDATGEDTVVELVSMGKYYEMNNVIYIIYDETEVTGLEGVRTTIKIYPESLVLLRSGTTRMRHQYILGDMQETVYETPLGALDLAVKTHELEVNLHEGSGEVHLGYDISIGGEWQFYNQLFIRVKEDTGHGNERSAAYSH